MSGLPTAGRGRGCVVMGVLNVTSDSFSDGGRFFDRDTAIAHGLALHRLGADIVDVGGESTRPGASRIAPETEAARVVPVIAALALSGVPISVDTMRARVAEAAVEAGAQVVNDVSGGRADPDMARVVADAEVPWILMHWRSAADHVHTAPTHYDDVVAEVTTELMERVDAALAAGVDPGQLVLDPGLGFAKTAAHNWALLRRAARPCGARVPGAGRGVAQALPGFAARERRRAETTRRPRDRHRRRVRVGSRQRGVGGAGARRRLVARRGRGRARLGTGGRAPGGRA